MSNEQWAKAHYENDLKPVEKANQPIDVLGTFTRLVEQRKSELAEQQGDARAVIGMGSHVIIDGCGATVIGLDPYTPRLEIEWDAPKGGKEYRHREDMTLAATGKQQVGEIPLSTQLAQAKVRIAALEFQLHLSTVGEVQEPDRWEIRYPDGYTSLFKDKGAYQQEMLAIQKTNGLTVESWPLYRHPPEQGIDLEQSVQPAGYVLVQIADAKALCAHVKHSPHSALAARRVMALIDGREEVEQKL